MLFPVEQSQRITMDSLLQGNIMAVTICLR